MYSVLIADHHPIIRKGIGSVLSNNPALEIIGCVLNGEKLYEFLEERTPDVVVMEIDLPRLNGITAIRNIKQLYPRIKLLIYSCHPEEMYALSTIKAGAAGYISKSAPTDKLETAIYQVARGGIYLNQAITQKLNAGISRGKTLIARFKKLSTRETEVLNLLSAGKRNKDIAEALDINEKTVSTYKTRLLKKLKVDNVADLITQARLLQLNAT